MKVIERAILAGVWGVLAVSAAAAQDDPADGWEWGADAYFWGASLGGETTAGDKIDIGIDKIVKDLNIGFMGLIEARRGPVSLFADGIYLNLEDSVHSTAIAKVNLQGAIVTAGAGYTVFDNGGTRLDALLGARFLWLDSELELRLGSLALDETDNESTLDAIVGFRGRTDLSDAWYLSYYGDVGTGESDFTWQAAATVNYRFERVDVAVGYRYMSWNLDDFGSFDNLNLHGPVVGIRMAF